MLLRQLSDAVRQDPKDLAKAVAFLDAVIYARQGTERRDLSWLAGLVKPVPALDAKALGERLQRLENWQPAVVYYQQAIAIPLTDLEIQDLGSMRQVSMSADQLRAEVAVTARDGMAECFLKLGQAEAAQRAVSEAATIRSQRGFWPTHRLEPPECWRWISASTSAAMTPCLGPG
jgi:tetratricopeptide (TPR) repeat protein